MQSHLTQGHSFTHSLKQSVPQRTRASGTRRAVSAASSLLYTCEGSPGHAKDEHPESPDRIRTIVQALQGRALPGLVEIGGFGRVASADELQMCHKPVYLEKLAQLCRGLQGPVMVDDSTYISPGSFEAVAKGVGAVFDLVDALMSLNGCALPPGDQLQQQQQVPAGAFALVRPPGHHVMPARPMGFGVFNTVALATRYVQSRYGMRRVMIFDFDVHHGNGTMEAFYEDRNVLYVSTHQDGLWPNTGKLMNTGDGEGKGYTINIPLPSGAGDQAMHRVVEQVLWPAAARFQPEFVVVSAGYDAHAADPLGQLQFSTNIYCWLSAELARMADSFCGRGRLLFVLEGGYHLESLGDSVVASMEGLLGSPGSAPLSGSSVGGEPMHRVEDVLQRVCSTHHL